MHAVGMARFLDMSRVIVPPFAGLFSSLGLLFADLEHHIVQTFFRRTDEVEPAELDRRVETMEQQVRTIIRREGVEEERQKIEAYADVQYVGQNTPLSIALPVEPAAGDRLAALAEEFAKEHERTYGYRSDREPVQLVSLKVVGRAGTLAPRIPERVSVGNHERSREERSAYFGPGDGWLETPVVDRKSLANGVSAGPLIVEEYDATTVIPPGCDVRLDDWGNLIIELTS